MAQRQDTLGFVVSDLARAMRRAFERRLEDSALPRTVTLAEARALVYVSRNEGIRQVDLAMLLEVQPMTLARLLDQLTAAGLVERRADPADRRAYRVFLTPRAAPQLAAIEQVIREVRRDATRGLSRAEVAATLVALRRMRSNL